MCHLFCLQPLRQRKPTTQHHLIQYSPVVHILLLLWGVFFRFFFFFLRHFKPFLKFLKYLYPICDTVCILPPEGRLCTVTVINELVGFPLQCREQGWREVLRRRENTDAQPSSSLWCKTAALLLFLSLRDSSFAALLNPSLEVSGNTNSGSTVYIRLHMNHRKMLSLPSVMQIRCIAEKMGSCIILFLCPPLL